MQGNQKFWRSVVAVMMVAIGLMAAAMPPVARADSGNPNPRVLPPHANAYGNSYGEWSARWWQWVLAIPEATNPNLDTTGADCAEGQTGKVWFLAGTFGASVTRACTVPTGRGLFFPILNTVFGAGVFDCEPTNPGVPCDVQALRAAAEAQLDDPTTLEVSIDGTPAPASA